MRARSLFGIALVVAVSMTAFLLSACQTMFVDPSEAGPGDDDFVVSGRTESFFRAIQVDPRSEDSAGPQVIDAGDIDGDGLMDLASGWNESQPIQVHLQRRDAEDNVYFETIPVGATTPIARMTDLKLADMDLDGRLDIVVLIKDTGLLATCDVERDDCDVTENGGIVEGAIDGGLVIFFTPEDLVADIWLPAVLTNSFFAGTDGDLPEEGGYTGLAIGDFDARFGPDIVTAFNSAEGEVLINRVDIYANPGGEASREDDSWDNTTVYANLPTAKDVAVLDVDRDGDQDILVTFPDAKSPNTFWLANPMSRDGVEAVTNPLLWNIIAPIGHVATGADRLAVGDVDGDGISDVMVRSSVGQVVVWFKAPDVPTTTFVRSPWQVFTMAEFLDRQPQAIALGDLTGDGQVEAVIAAEGAMVWFDSGTAPSVYDQWGENLIIDEGPPPEPVQPTTAPPTTTQPAPVTTTNVNPAAQTAQQAGTLINAVLIVDIDGDGFNDIVGTVDRDERSGLADDALVWFRNTRTR